MQNPPIFTLKIKFFLYNAIFIAAVTSAYSQNTIQPNYYGSTQQSQNFMATSTAFKQEIARMEINVVRQGKAPKPITQIPRLQKDDVLKVRLLEEPVNGMKPDQSNFNWTFLVAYINPGRNNDKENSVSEEINFRKSGWYREYSFTVPYDSQPIFFIYPRPKYRAKVLNLINKNAEEIRKIGEKTLELAGAYAKIGAFVGELQFVLNRGINGFGNAYGYGYGSGSSYGNSYGSYGGYSNYSNYNNFGTNQGYNYNLLAEQSVERIARSFSIQLPSCWQNSFSGYSSFGTNTNTVNYGVNQDMIGRMQCVARSVRVEDLDVSVGKFLQQGGILGVSQLSLKYPQISYWITIAAAALDVILKINKKSPLKIVPTVMQATDNQSSAFVTAYQPSALNGNTSPTQNQVKISLFAESQPSDNDFVTAYPLVIHKWQANADPEIIELPAPTLMESCLHPGQNILKNTDLNNTWMDDAFTQDFKLIISSANGFRKEFPLKKNIGMNGWELNVSKEDLNSFPKINMAVDSVVVGTRGFNELKSPKFSLPLPVGGTWTVSQQSQKDFAVGGKKIVTITNELGGCRCLQTVVYKPSFGGQFVFGLGNGENSVVYSNNGKEASFEIDTTNFQPGKGQLELVQNGGEVSVIDINLYPAPPSIKSFKISKGDKQAVITGERLEQLRAIKINGKRATVTDANSSITGVNNTTSLSGFVNSPTTTESLPNTYTQTISTEKTVVFDDQNASHDSNVIALELELEGNRFYSYPDKFTSAPTRPSIISNESHEIDGLITGINKLSEIKEDKRSSSIETELNKSQFDLQLLPIFPIETSGISVNIRNALTDYDFKTENIRIETRIENSQVSQTDLPKTDFEVLDWKNIKINFLINEQSQRLLGGRKLQFRIRDKQRGDSDWYTLKRTFVRIPKINAVRCGASKTGNCELEGKGLDYISHISVDGGKTWHVQDPTLLNIKSPIANEQIAVIPYYSDKKMLQIKLRDFSGSNGLAVSNYGFVNGQRLRTQK